MKQWGKSIESEKERRRTRPPRVDMGHLGNLVCGGGEYIPVVVENVSADGVLMQSNKVLVEDAKYELVCGRERVHLKIVWTNHPFVGAKFSDC